MADGFAAERAPSVAGGHFVQFYERDEVLVDSVHSFIETGLNAGEGAIVIATAEHRAALSAKLRASGVAVSGLQASGALVLVDAAAMLGEILVDGAPDETRFNQTLGAIVARAGRNRTGLRAFGEMVALLSAGGSVPAAIRLEELWNELAGREGFSLLCGYPIATFGSARDAEAFQQVCRCHARVIPVANPGENQTEDERNRTIALLQQKAAAFEREVHARKQAEAQLAAELADSRLLHTVSAELISEQNIGRLYEKLVDAAVGIMRSDFASMQMFYPDKGPRGALRLLASRGFSPEAQRCWEWVSHETASSCGEVLRSGGRVIARDVKECEFLIRLGGLDAYLGAGIHAMQSTPLISRAGNLVGMISTHWRHAHEPSERDLRLFDILARQAADVVERTRAEDRLRQSEEHLERTVEERTAQLRDTVAELEAFSYSIAHDMRAPLRAMNGYARLLEKDFAEALPPTAKGFLHRMALGAGRLDRLITDVLNYSKITRGDMLRESVNIEQLTREIIDSYPNLRESGATILVQSSMPQVLGNTAALTQCISNLLANAVKFVAPGTQPKVSIRADVRGKAVRYSIEDNGIGIDAGGRERIFRMFQRLNLATEFEGTGIGLTIVRKAVERMGGQVGVDSTPGVGSVFWIELPRVK